jgi:hypothetical protein
VVNFGTAGASSVMLKIAISLLIAGAILAIARVLIGIWFGQVDAEVSPSFIRAISIAHFFGKNTVDCGNDISACVPSNPTVSCERELARQRNWIHCPTSSGPE